MRPKTTRKELPTSWTCRAYINNAFVDFIADLQKTFQSVPGQVSVNWDLWTRENTSESEFGMTGQWIQITSAGTWALRVEVLAFHPIAGKHDGDNLGRYFLRLTDRVGITSKAFSKVSKSLLRENRTKINYSLATARQTMQVTTILRRRLLNDSSRPGVTRTGVRSRAASGTFYNDFVNWNMSDRTADASDMSFHWPLRPS